MNGSQLTEGREPAAWYLAVPALAFTLWDFYFGPYQQGYRVFDFLGVCVLLALGLYGGVAALSGHWPDRWVRLSRLLLLLLVVYWFVIGSFRGALEQLGAWRPAAGLAMGLGVFTVFSFSEISARQYRWLVESLIWVHVVALLVQWITFQATGQFLNYQAISGGEPRVFSQVFRPSGLFLEPGGYSQSMSMLLLLRYRVCRRLDLVVLLGMLTMLISLSLFGVLMSAFLLSIYAVRSGVAGAGAVALIGLAAVGLGAAFREEAAFILARVQGIGTDYAIRLRYGGALERLLAGEWTANLLFGEGVSNAYLGFGSSGLAFLLQGFGVVGGGVVAAMLVMMSPLRGWLYAAVALALSLLPAPLWTIMFWWFFLGLLTNQLRAATHPLPSAGRPR